MKKVTALLLALIFIMSFVPAIVIAEEYVITVPASNCGHSGSAAGTGLFIGCVDDVKGNVHRAEFIPGVTGNNSITVGSTRTGAIEFEVDGNLNPETITRANLKVYVHDINGNLGNDWMLLAAYETENPKLTYSVGGMDNTLFPAVEDKYSYGAAFWSDERCTRSDPGWKTLNVTRAVVNALKKDNGQSEKVRVVLRLQVPAAGLNISTDDNKPYMEIVTGEKAPVKVKFVDNYGNEVLPEQEFYAGEGSYKYTGLFDTSILTQKALYTYNMELSELYADVDKNAENVITIVYDRLAEEDFFSGYPLIVEGATCWFADPRSVRFAHEDIYENGELVLPASDKTIAGAIDDEGTVKAVQYDNITGELVSVTIDTEYQQDDHNNPTFLYLPDKRIMVFWSMHTAEEYWYYRVTEEPDDLKTLGEEHKVPVLGYGTYTYPSPFYMTDQPDSFFLCWRGVNWHPTIAKYSLPDENGDITCEINPTQLVQTIAARPYVKYESNGKDRIYFTFTTGHPDNELPNWVHYAEVDINTLDLYDVENNLLCEGEMLPFGKTNKINTKDDYGSLTVDAPADNRDWVWDVCKGDDGNPVILFTRISSNRAQHDYYYGKWNSDTKVWDKTYIADGGGWFHQDGKKREQCYSGGMCLDHSDPSTVYLSKPTNGYYGRFYEIWKVQLENGEIISETPVTKNSQYNNVRPFVAWGSEKDDPIRLTWMHGLYYYWIGDNAFPTTIMTQNKVPEFTYGYGLEKLSLPEYVVNDIKLPSFTADTLRINWSSSNEAVISKEGVVHPSKKDEIVILTAVTEKGEKEFKVMVPARDPEKHNLILKYAFSPEDKYEKDNEIYVKDLSGNDNDALIAGSAVIDGTLNLTANTTDFAANGCAIAPAGILDGIRSYSITAKINAKNFEHQPRIYDFGINAWNSMFLRANAFSAGFKFDSGATVLISPEMSLEANTEYFLTVTYNASDNTTKIYVNGVLAGEDTTITNAPEKVSGSRNYIGRTQWWDGAYSADNADFCGIIDDFALYDTVLNEEEIRRMYDNDASLVDFDAVYENGEVVVNIVKNDAPKDAVIVVATYNDDNVMLSAVIAKENVIRLPYAEHVRVFCIKSFDSMEPLCGATIKTVNDLIKEN